MIMPILSSWHIFLQCHATPTTYCITILCNDVKCAAYQVWCESLQLLTGRCTNPSIVMVAYSSQLELQPGMSVSRDSHILPPLSPNHHHHHILPCLPHTWPNWSMSRDRNPTRWVNQTIPEANFPPSCSGWNWQCERMIIATTIIWRQKNA